MFREFCLNEPMLENRGCTVKFILSKQEEWNVKCEFAEWQCSLWHIPSGFSVDWWSVCQEPLTLNTEWDLPDKMICCWCPPVLLRGSSVRLSAVSTYIKKSPRTTICGQLLLWKITFAYIVIEVMIFVSQGVRKIVHSGKRFVWRPSPSIQSGMLAEATSASQALLCHDGLHDPPGGVCPFS